ncbi:hypothetical protein O6H91_02G044900 [Diphasiastrum complanatum]|uniref:Uncharacterized protein n=3 Tax=Diphasiastrum complanatum TaxID=34168 RepID=A0ACC2EEX2_DIPCM|nr:hypothetical protein O6H91_02G044900 [Diphasiastrum complanatum]KAJ7565030.1 hypothetical protein O6H91_02G044900 [Diphasiastrum complanatum]KAJ7565032.1 hypothetical protein O6H91_02G044900 [Diphasiastrum complanatum]
MGSGEVRYSSLAAGIFGDILDAVIVDVASEAHRAARLGFDRRLNTEEEEELRLSAQARAIVGESVANGDTSSKYTIDVFGQLHPAVASEIFECMNCGRPIVAGRFAPHLEKCMGKGRKARIRANANINLSQQRKVRSSPLPSYFPGGPTHTSVSSRTPPTQTSSLTPEDTQKSGLDPNDGTSEESHDDDDKGQRGRIQSGAWQVQTYL